MVNRPHILVVDDDDAIRELVGSYLTENEFRVSGAASGAEMTQLLQAHVIDLVLLDLRLDGEDGMQLARQLREGGEIPVIILTGRLEEADRVMGLEMAADDYVTKPFSNREMLARIRAVLRRYRKHGEAVAAANDPQRRAYRFDGWELNLLARRLTAPDGRRVELSNGEFNLLQALCEAPQRVLSRDRLLELSRLHGAEVYDRSIDVQILRLRRKIEGDPSSPRFIQTERGAGYVFNTPVDVLS
ncbi:response regulator [Variovorax sp. ZT4R33]|uniref:response regulator n=1 Tax=Variovorax sp. ZT4R33 TaxID=3443743 RepID=UPI003F482143